MVKSIIIGALFPGLTKLSIRTVPSVIVFPVAPFYARDASAEVVPTFLFSTESAADAPEIRVPVVGSLYTLILVVSVAEPPVDGPRIIMILSM